VTDHGGPSAARTGGQTVGLAKPIRPRTPWAAPKCVDVRPGQCRAATPQRDSTCCTGRTGIWHLRVVRPSRPLRGPSALETHSTLRCATICWSSVRILCDLVGITQHNRFAVFVWLAGRNCLVHSRYLRSATSDDSEQTLNPALEIELAPDRSHATAVPDVCVGPSRSHSWEEITTIAEIASGFVKRLAEVMLLIAFICACKNTAVPIESRARADPRTQVSERLIVIGVDNESVEFLARAGGTPRDYDITPYGSTSRARHLMRAIEYDYGLRELSAWPIEPLHVHCAVLQIPDGADRESLLARLSHDPRIKLVQPLQPFETRNTMLDDWDARAAREMAPHAR
jgi:hypothetical protein